MARRTGLPERIRAELPTRARAGIGHDPNHLTPMADKMCRANDARSQRPSPYMVEFVRRIVDHLHEVGATHITIAQDLQHLGHQGSLTVQWAGAEATVASVAAKFAVSTSLDGTPRLPAWVSLRNDDDFDLRWQARL